MPSEQSKGNQVNTKVTMHLLNRDRFALAFRITGALAGFAFMGLAFATSSWSKGWVVALFIVVVVGGGLAYHLLTSIVRCPSCRSAVFNLGIGPVDAKRKFFCCRRCGTTAWLAEGFYWQSDVNG
jgi:hypothetical protein